MSKGYNTNLASEFYVLSVLHRLGHDAALTLGNKKAIDLTLVASDNRPRTIDVKGLAGATGWPVDNARTIAKSHFYVFVAYVGKIRDPSFVPECYVVPSAKLESLTYFAPGGRQVVPLGRMRREGKQFRDAWGLLGPFNS